MTLALFIDPGTSVGPYVVERRLAQGGMSVLYLARDVNGARVVLKMLTPDIATNATRARMMREARALAAVDHPGVVRIHGTGEHDGMPWIAMDYVQGVDLKRAIAERGALPVDVAIGYAIQAADALVAAHDAGVVHRDLKPSNLLLTSDGRIVLVDFGIAKRRTDVRDGDIVTSARELLGTPAYLSPEQLEHGLADERSDVWALGCVLYEMVAGAPPFGRGGSTTTASILRDEPVFPPHVPDGVVQVISACLRKNSFARVASPRELLSLLRDALEDSKSEHPATIERASSTRRSSARPSPRPSAPPPATMPPRAPSESRISKAPSRPPSAPPPESSSTRSSSILPPRSSGSSRPAWSSGAMRAAVPRGCVKGTAVRAGLSWFADTYGEASVARCIEFASPELKAMLRITDPAFGIMPSGWYETHLIGELLDALERAISPKGAEAFSSRLAEAIARDNVGGIYRSLFRLVASPTLLTANAQRVWRTYMDEGTLTVLLQAPASFEARVRGWAHHNSSVCRLLQPMVEHSLRAVGYAGLTVLRKQCVDRGDTQCVFEGTWEPSG